jgi:4-carboxymuconolactone decarboxylase
MTHSISRHRGAVRFLLVALGLPQLLVGLQALADSRGWYDKFPFGRGWVEALPPYNQHLIVDVGALFIGLGVLMIIAAVALERRLVTAALATWLLYAVPHFVFHLTQLEPYGTGDAVASVASQAGQIAAPLLILWLLRARHQPAPAASAASNGVRMAGVPDGRGGLIARVGFRASRQQTGAVLEPVRIYAHHPLLMTGYGALEEATRRSHRVPERIKALAEMRAAMLAGCEWCLDFGSSVALQSGLSEEQLAELPTYRDSERFDEVERLVLDYASGMSRTPVDVPDELFARLHEHFDEAQMVELTSAIAIENYRARFNWAFGLGSQGFSEGSFCVRPAEAATSAA